MHKGIDDIPMFQPQGLAMFPRGAEIYSFASTFPAYAACRVKPTGASTYHCLYHVAT